MRFDRPLFAFLLLLLLGLPGCSGKNAENTTVGAASGVSGDDKPEQTQQEQGFSFLGAASGDCGDRKPAAEPADVIKGWGKKEDPAGGTTIELQDTTLVMTTPDIYVDNYPPAKVNAPRVLEEVSGDFIVEVRVTHLDPSKTDSVLKSLGSFPTAYHAGTLLIRTNEKNLIRFERVSKNTNGMLSTTCEMQVWESGKRTAYASAEIEDIVLQLRLERRGDQLLCSFSQDDGQTWKELPQHTLHKLKDTVKVGVSLTNNTDPGCTVKFQDFKVVKGEGR